MRELKAGMDAQCACGYTIVTVGSVEGQPEDMALLVTAQPEAMMAIQIPSPNEMPCLLVVHDAHDPNELYNPWIVPMVPFGGDSTLLDVVGPGAVVLRALGGSISAAVMASNKTAEQNAALKELVEAATSLEHLDFGSGDWILDDFRKALTRFKQTVDTEAL
jgi:hypothetical protein